MAMQSNPMATGPSRRRTMLVPMEAERMNCKISESAEGKALESQSVLVSKQAANEERWFRHGRTHSEDKSGWLSAWAASSAAGLMDGQNKMNQDIVAGEVLPSRTWFLVCDGHGAAGTSASRAAAEAFARHLKEVNEKVCYEMQLQNAIAAAEQACIEKLGQAAVHSGTTLVGYILTESYELHIASIGDSICHFVSFDESGTLMYQWQSKPHRCETDTEKSRLEAAGATIKDGRVWRLQPNKPPELGLAMSRSLGDTAAKAIGVSAEPDITTLKLPADCHSFILLLSSDGISDVLDLNRLAHDVFYPILTESAFLHEISPTDAAARLDTELATIDQQAEAIWWKDADEDDQYVDDRSFVVLLAARANS